jgi:hypothetical protein
MYIELYDFVALLRVLFHQEAPLPDTQVQAQDITNPKLLHVSLKNCSSAIPLTLRLGPLERTNFPRNLSHNAQLAYCFKAFAPPNF